MRRLLFILIIFLGLGFIAPSVSAAPSLDKIETSLFGFTFPNETDALRLNRIETEVYGTAGSGSNSQRLAKLDKDLAAGSIGKEIAPTPDTLADSRRAAPAPAPKADPSVDYPAVNELEQIAFNKEFKTKPLNSRLDALEQKAFKKTYANDDLSTRVDRLKADLKPARTAQKSQKSYYDDEIELPQQNYNYNMYQPPSGKTNLAHIEKSMFKKSYPNDNMDNRLSRLEDSMFGTTFDSDSEQERLDRVTSAASAQKSARKYDSNKLTQTMSTGMQIGMFLLMVLGCIL